MLRLHPGNAQGSQIFSRPHARPILSPQALHGSRVHIESDFDTLCEEAALPDKLHQLEELCQVQGVARGAGDLTADASAQPTLAVRAALLAARKAEVEQLEAILSVVAKAREEESRKLEERLAQVQEACRRLGPLAALDTNVSRACLMWENHKSGPATLA